MQDPTDKNPLADNELEAALAELVPTAAAVDRDQLMYQAGWDAACAATAMKGRSHFWQATSGLMTAATIALAFVLAQQNSNRGAVAAVADRPSQDSVESKPAVAEPDNVDNSVAIASPVASAAEAVSPRRFAAPAWQFGDPATNYLALREVVLTRGVESWPAAYRDSSKVRTGQVDRTRDTSARELLDQMLREAKQPDALGEDGQPVGSQLLDQETTV